MQYTTTIFTSPQEVKEISSEWSELLQLHPLPNPFLSSSVMLLIWKHFFKPTHELSVVVIKQDDRIVGILPGAQKGSQWTLLAHLDVTDYADVLISADSNPQAVFAAGCRALKKRGVSEMLAVSIPNKSWMTKLAASHPSWQVTQQEIAPIISLPQTWTEYLRQLKRKYRHEIRRKQRRLDELPHQVEIYQQLSAAPQLWQDFKNLHQASSTDKALFWTEPKEHFFKELLDEAGQQQWLRLFFLNINQKRCATMLLFQMSNSIFLYNSGYLPEYYGELGTGSILTAHTIKWSIEESLNTYDFLRGDEQYKFRFGATSQPIFDISLSL